MTSQTSSKRIVPGAGTYAGVFLVSLTTLMYEILLTRFFSVMMWYHFSFVAISVAMFGMTLGAIVVYLYPRFFSRERVHLRLALFALLGAVAVLVCSLAILCMPVMMQPPGGRRLVLWAYSLATVYLVAAVPLVFSGIVISLALTKFHEQVGRLYAADLLGAAAGCVVLVRVLGITDGPSCVLLLAALLGLAVPAFGGQQLSPRLRTAAVFLCTLCGLAFVGNSLLANRQQSLLQLLWVKGRPDGFPLYEKWNSFSRVAVYGDPDQPMRPAGWGLSPRYERQATHHRLYLDIDAYASTLLPRFSGDTNEIAFLAYDITQIAHHIRTNANVVVMGSGGGSDILAALLFNQKSVTGVEINESIVRAANGVFGDFTGHLDKDPRVRFVVEDARSYIARQTGRFDIIQASLIDSFAATAAGAFTLTENSLYTAEAWEMFLRRLSPDGILTFSRVYTAKSPGEVYRLVALGSTALRRLGADAPRKHIVLLRLISPGAAWGIGTILVSPAPLSDSDLDILEQVSERMAFDIVLSPRSASDARLAEVVECASLDRLVSELRLNIRAPTDDSPFFFHMLRLRDVFRPDVWLHGPHRTHLVAPVILVALLVIVLLLTGGFVLVPLLVRAGTGPLKGSPGLVLYFAGIGLGFMLVEVSQMQTLNIFLGHPVYALSVTLFSLLLSAGIGSYTVGRVARGRPAWARLGLLLVVLIAYIVVVPHVLHRAVGAPTLVRILVAVVSLGMAGFFMGMPFPLGMKLAARRSADLTPWLWGLNGAASVLASVLAVAISMTRGIRVSFLTGLLCYGVACLCYVLADRRSDRS